MVRDWLAQKKFFSKLSKSRLYVRTRQYFPIKAPFILDDSNLLEDAEIIKLDWPDTVKKPCFGVVQDYGKYPKWTKYCRFFKNNSFNYDIYDIHHHSWLRNAERFDVIVGLPSNSVYHLQEIRNKYHILETYLGKKCYPSTNHCFLYEDKCIEAYISQTARLPFANTYISYEKKDAMSITETLKYPFVSKIVPSSGSVGVELVRTHNKAVKIVNEVFSRAGRRTHNFYHSQKNFIYFQEYIPNDGYDTRIIIAGKRIFGYYRKVPKGDFRASGMNIIEERELPEEAMKIALAVNKIVKSPVLAVDMLHGLDGKYHIIEFSPLYQMDSSAELRVNDIPGAYIVNENGTFHFETGRYWVAELAIREFLVNEYLPNLSA
jgi:glutathione synthase/RimK-type ligase-like ATP-grasp enzyme